MPSLAELMQDFFATQLNLNEPFPSLTDLQYAFYLGVKNGDIVLGGAPAGVDVEVVRDTIVAALRASGYATITSDDIADTITIGTSAALGTALADLASAINLRALAADTVNLVGNQTVEGVKTFSSSPVVPANSFAQDRVVGLPAALTGLVIDSVDDLPITVAAIRVYNDVGASWPARTTVTSDAVRTVINVGDLLGTGPLDNEANDLWTRGG